MVIRTSYFISYCDIILIPNIYQGSNSGMVKELQRDASTSLYDIYGLFLQ